MADAQRQRMDLRGHGAFGSFLQSPIDGEHRIIAGDRLEAGDFSHRFARRVYFDATPAFPSAQPAIGRILQTVFANHVIGPVASRSALFVLLLRNLTDVSEKM